ncbi:MAG TPA: histidinol-phosphate transaminase [Roseiflexaceae bacterium]|nr:histidinol-phosphate transaminase [Roseiflexaceae bacterium]
MHSIATLIRPDIAALEPYTPIVPTEVLAARLGLPPERIVKLDANENPYGPSPRARAALAATSALDPNPYAIYPDPGHTRLRQALAGFTGQPPERILCGAGADELIDLLMRATLLPGDAVIDCPPTFGMYSFDAGLYAARVASVPRDAAFELDLEGIAEAAERTGARLLFVAAPNNPSGNPLPRPHLHRLLELPLLVVVDEAYAEFAGHNVADMVGGPPNLVVLRTFSKWAGLAGLRVGYALCHEELADHLMKIKQPYNVNVAAEVAALASLEDLDERMEKVRLIVAERERLFHALAALPGLRPYPSQANFILVRVLPAGDERPANDRRSQIAASMDERSSFVAGRSPAERARAIRDALRQRGILIRYFQKPGLEDCIRVSVGTPAQNDALLSALREIL